MSNRSPAERTPPLGPSYKVKGGPPQVEVNIPKYNSQPPSIAGSYHNTPSPSLRSPASNDNPWGSRSGSPSGRSKALIIPEAQPRRDQYAPRSPLAQSHNANGHLFGEPSPVSDWQAGISNAVSPMSNFQAEDHGSRQGYLPSPPASSTRQEFNNKPSRENLNPHGAAYRAAPAGNAVRLVGTEETRNVRSGTPLYSGPAPLPSPALSGMVQHDRDDSDDEAWDLPAIRTVGAHRDTLTRLGPRQTSVTANIEGPNKSPLAEFRFSDDDEEVLQKANRSSTPVEFREMNRAHKPLPLVLQKDSSERLAEESARQERVPQRVPERVASPLASPPSNRAEAGLGICGDWPLGAAEMPGGMVAEPPAQIGFMPKESRGDRGMGPLGEPEVQGPTRGPMPESRGPPIVDTHGVRVPPPDAIRSPERRNQGPAIPESRGPPIVDTHGVRVPPPDVTRSPEGRNHGQMRPTRSQLDHANVPGFMRPGPPPGTYSGPPPGPPPGTHQQSSPGAYSGPPAGPPPGSYQRSGTYSGSPPGPHHGHHPRSPPGAYPGPAPAREPRSPTGAYPGQHAANQPRSPQGPNFGPPPKHHGGLQHPPGNISPSSYRGVPGTGRPQVNGPGPNPDPRSNYGRGPGPIPGPPPNQPWARAQGATPPPRGPTGTPGPRGPLRPKNEGSRQRPAMPGMPSGPPPESGRSQNEFPLPPGHGGPGGPMSPLSAGSVGPQNEFPLPPRHGWPGGPMGPSPGGMPSVKPPLPPGTPGIDAMMKTPPIRTRNGTPAPMGAPQVRKHDPLPPPPRGMTPTLMGPPPSAPPSGRAPSPPRNLQKNQIRPQQSAPQLDFAFNFPTAQRAPQPEPAPPKFTCPRPAPPSPAPGAARPAHFDNPNWPLAAPISNPSVSPPPNKALPPAPHGAGHRAWGGGAESEWPGPRRNPMTHGSPVGWGPMVR